jgi:D-alanyl-D-alanine dipeptidase
MRSAWLLLACALPWLGACASTPGVQVSPAQDAAQVDLVDAASVVPGLLMDIRYAGADNFVGAPVTGYEAPKCLLLAPVAQALARVQQDVEREGLSLKVFDCYRPVRAVQHFVRWAHDPTDQHTKPAYYPNLEKASLLDGYIAEPRATVVAPRST